MNSQSCNSLMKLSQNKNYTSNLIKIEKFCYHSNYAKQARNLFPHCYTYKESGLQKKLSTDALMRINRQNGMMVLIVIPSKLKKKLGCGRKQRLHISRIWKIVESTMWVKFVVPRYSQQHMMREICAIRLRLILAPNYNWTLAVHQFSGSLVSQISSQVCQINRIFSHTSR